MDKYLKMDDVFEGEVKVKHIDEEAIAEIVDGEDSGKYWSIEDSRYWLAMSYEHAGYAAHAINSHDELVENMQHYKQDAELWEARAVKEASRANDLQAEVERLRGEIDILNCRLEKHMERMIDRLHK